MFIRMLLGGLVYIQSWDSESGYGIWVSEQDHSRSRCASWVWGSDICKIGLGSCFGIRGSFPTSRITYYKD